jgi:hypothetical protein
MYLNLQMNWLFVMKENWKLYKIRHSDGREENGEILGSMLDVLYGLLGICCGFVSW